MSLALAIFLSFPFIGNQGLGTKKINETPLRGEVDTVIVQEISKSGIYFSEILWAVNWSTVRIEDEEGEMLTKDDLEKLAPFEAEVIVVEDKFPLVTTIRVLGPGPHEKGKRPSDNRESSF